MREIKFRAWDREQKHLFDVDTLCPDHVIDMYCSVHPRRVCDIEQFTGLRDKNGREIYEGDILAKWDSMPGWNEEKDEPNPPKRTDQTDVATMERFPCFWLKDEGFGCEGEDLEDSNNWEVIGNIHENPELLS